MKKVLLATGQDSINKAVTKFENYNILAEINYKKEVIEAITYYKPDIILIADGLLGNESLIEIMINLKNKNPKIKIIYLTTIVDLKNERAVNRLGNLVLNGIYDIFQDEKITRSSLKYLFDNNKDLEDVEYLLKYLKEEVVQKVIEIEEDFNEEEDDDDCYKNVFLISSIKPGTGKSFISVNIAANIAKFGNINGKLPKVALIEGDLQNLSVGTLLSIEDDKKNLKTVMDKISTIINSNGELKGNLEQIENVNSFIKDCFKPYSKVNNLFALVGSQLSMEEIEDIKPEYYIYLIDVIVSEFDIIIIDSNSSLAHITTYPLLQLSKNAYYILNLDYNNIRNNIRYKDTLKNIGVLDKVKYILNEDITNNAHIQQTEKLMFDSYVLENETGFKLESKIPIIDKTVFLNRVFEGIPICLTDSECTLEARYEIAKVSNTILEVSNYKKLEKEIEYLKGKDFKNKEKSKKNFFK